MTRLLSSVLFALIAVPDTARCLKSHGLNRVSDQIRMNMIVKGHAQDRAGAFAPSCDAIFVHDSFDPVFPGRQHHGELAMPHGVILLMSCSMRTARALSILGRLGSTYRLLRAMPNVRASWLLLIGLPEPQ